MKSKIIIARLYTVDDIIKAKSGDYGRNTVTRIKKNIANKY